MRTTTNAITTVSRPTTTEGLMVIPNNPECLEDIWRQALDIQSKCLDVNIQHTRNMYFDYTPNGKRTLMYTPDNVVSYGKYISGDKDYDTKTSFLTPYSFGQLCAKLGIPFRYIDKCEKAGLFELVRENLNTWITNDNREVLLRLYNNDIRGVLGSRYSALDAPEIVQVLAQSHLICDFKVKGYVIDPTRLHIRLVSCEPLHIAGEDLFPGIAVTSSDVGRSSLKVQFFVYKQVCTNGLMLPVTHSLIFYQKHMGLTFSEFTSGLKDSLFKCSEYAVDVQLAIERVKNHSKMTRKEFTDLLTKGSDNIIFSDKISEEIIDLQYEVYTPTPWGLINAITEYAQRFSLERRMQFEEAAGKLLFRNI